MCTYVCLCGGCVHAEAYHNKQSKYPVGIHTFSLPPISLRHFWDSAHSTAHIQITQPAKAPWMTSALLSNTHTYIRSCMHACTHIMHTQMLAYMQTQTSRKPFPPQSPRIIGEYCLPLCTQSMYCTCGLHAKHMHSVNTIRRASHGSSQHDSQSEWLSKFPICPR